MGFFKGNNNKTDEERLWEMLNVSGKGTYSSYSDSRKKEILDIFKESEQKAIDTISIDLQKDIEEQKNEEKKEKKLKI